MRKILLITLFCFTFMSFHNANNVPKRTNTHRDTSFLNVKELNDSILYLALVYYDIKHPKAVLAQAKLESSNYTSKVYKKNKNFLGLYNSKEKKYFKFKHWTECILAYKDKIEYKHRDGENYYYFLDRIGYASDPNYINKIKEIENTL